MKKSDKWNKVLQVITIGVALSSILSCASVNRAYRTVSPKSDKNLSFNEDRPEKDTERLFLSGELLKVIFFENTNKKFVYIPMTIGVNHEALEGPSKVWTPDAFEIWTRKHPREKWEPVGKDYLLLENHRYLEALKSINFQDAWEQYYKNKWDAREQNRLQRDPVEADPQQFTQEAPEKRIRRTFSELGYVLICEPGLFEYGRSYQFKFTIQVQQNEPEIGQDIIYECIVDRNNAFIGVGIGLIIVGLALAASA